MFNRRALKGMVRAGLAVTAGAMMSGVSGAQEVGTVGTGGGVSVPQILVVAFGIFGLILLVSALRRALQSDSTKRVKKKSERLDGPQHPEQSSKQNGLPVNSSPQPDEGEEKVSRRTLVLGGAGVIAIVVAVIFLPRQEGTGPDAAAERFVRAIDDTNFSRIDEMIHSESPLDGADDALDLFSGLVGAEQAVDALDISVEDSTIVREGDGQADVEVTIGVDLLIEEPSTEVPLEMRTDNGEWRVWNIGL